MAKELELFTWYKSTATFQNELVLAFFIGKPSSEYNSVGIVKTHTGEWKYVGFTGYNISNPDIWRKTRLPKDMPSKFLCFVIIELFSERLKETLWQK